MHSSAKNKIVNFFLGVGGLIVSLFLVEVLLPYAKLYAVEQHYYQYHVPIIQYLYGKFHPRLGFTLQPKLQDVRLSYPPQLDYAVSSNSDGFRGAEIDWRPSRRNIVVIGDSFAMGWGIPWPRTFSQLLAARLQALDPAYQVVNLGISGYDLDQIIACYDQYGKGLRPEYTIYLFCYNDTAGIMPDRQGGGQFELATAQAKRGGEAEFIATAKRNNVLLWSWERFWKGSRLYGFYKAYLLTLFDKHRKPWTKKLDFKNIPPARPPVEPVPLDDEQKKYLWFGLEKLSALTAGRPLILMHTSHIFAFHMKDSAKSTRWILRDFAQSHPNSHFVDFETKIRELNDGVARFFPIDDHWNEEGHRLAAELLMEEVRKGE